MFLHSIDRQDVFHTAIPAIPMGKYAHIVVLRETDSFPLFQTDQELNFARVSAGREPSSAEKIISRIVLFKRKQTTPERLTGRELLRRYHFINDDEDDETGRYCEYNSERFCKRCPDCIYYGFAIGQEGSERSKVLVDSAFSISDYDQSHQSMTFNAPYEHGTMSRHGETRSSINEQDHVLPQIFFPGIITLRDPTEAGFLYVFNNILRTKRYGAQTTRTGTLENHVVAVIFTDGEIFSNLKLTQKLYDEASKSEQGQPYPTTYLINTARNIIPSLLREDRVTTHLLLVGEQLHQLIEDASTLLTHEETLTQVLQQAYTETRMYAQQHGALKKDVGGKGKTKAAKVK